MNKEKSTRGVSYVGVLTIIFAVLKAVGVIDWSWIWVLSPIWITAGIVLALLFIYFVGLLIEAIIKKEDK